MGLQKKFRYAKVIFSLIKSTKKKKGNLSNSFFKFWLKEYSNGKPNILIHLLSILLLKKSFDKHPEFFIPELNILVELFEEIKL